MSLSRRNPAAARAAVSDSVMSLGVELLIQVNATLSELARMADAQIDPGIIRQLRDLLAATETLVGSRHFSADPAVALRESSNQRASVAADALAQSRHWLRVLDALYSPKVEGTNG